MEYTKPEADTQAPHLWVVEDQPLYDGHPPAKRRQQQGGFCMVPKEVRALKDLAALGVYTILAFHFNDQDECWPSHETIAGELGTSLSTVKRAIHRLSAAGIIRIETRANNGMKRSNKYVRTIGQREPSIGHTDLTDSSQGPIELEPRELDQKELLRSSKKKPSKIPPYDFQPTPEMIEWAETKGFSRSMIDRETERFRNHDFKAAHTDWTKTWRNWFLASWMKPDAIPSSNGLAKVAPTDPAEKLAWLKAINRRDFPDYLYDRGLERWKREIAECEAALGGRR